MNSHEKRSAQVGDLGGADNETATLDSPIIVGNTLIVKPLIARDLSDLRRALVDVAIVGDPDHAQRLERVYHVAQRVARVGGVTNG